MISIQPGSSLAQRIFFNEAGDEAKPKALIIMLVLCMSRQQLDTHAALSWRGPNIMFLLCPILFHVLL